MQCENNANQFAKKSQNLLIPKHNLKEINPNNFKKLWMIFLKNVHNQLNYFSHNQDCWGNLIYKKHNFHRTKKERK